METKLELPDMPGKKIILDLKNGYIGGICRADEVKDQFKCLKNMGVWRK